MWNNHIWTCNFVMHNCTIISFDLLTAFNVSSRRLSFEEDSFTKFTVDMMRQYMKEDEIRAKHQVSQVEQHYIHVLQYQYSRTFTLRSPAFYCAVHWWHFFYWLMFIHGVSTIHLSGHHLFTMRSSKENLVASQGSSAVCFWKFIEMYLVNNLTISWSLTGVCKM